MSLFIIQHAPCFQHEHVEKSSSTNLLLFVSFNRSFDDFQIHGDFQIHHLAHFNPLINFADPFTKELIVDFYVKNQLRSGVLRNRLTQPRLANGSTELYLRCPNLTAIGWDNYNPHPLRQLQSLLQIDLSGCPKLESIPELAFAGCHHLVSVAFGDQSNITNLGRWAFNRCNVLSPR